MIKIKLFFENLLNQKLIKYFFVGGCAAIIDISIFFVFAKLLNFNYLIVSAVSFIIATLVNYLLSIRFVFQTNLRFETKTELILVYIISSIGLLLHLFILYMFIDQLFFEKMISKFIASGTVFIWNFAARNYLVFKERELVS